MSFSLHIDVHRQQVEIRIEGARRSGEWELMLAELIDHRDFSDGFDILIDASTAEPIEAPDLRRAVTFFRAHAEHFRSCRVAAVVGNPAGYGMARMAQGLTGTDLPTFKIFWSVDEAQGWLSEPRERKLG